MDDAMIAAEGLRKRFGETWALAGLDLRVAPGTVCGLLGPNGAGKTTAVRVLSTLCAPDAGRARIAGFDAVTEPAQVRARIGVARQYAALDEALTGRDNLRLFGRLYHLSRREARRRADELLDRFRLAHAADRQVRTYSGGMRRRLDLITSLIIAPKVLFLDEPTTGLDPLSRGEIWDTVRTLVAEGTTVLLTTQYLEEADQLADDIAVVDRGRIVASGPPDELKGIIGDRVDVTLARPAPVERAAALLAAEIGDGPAELREDGFSLPVPTGAATLVDVVRRLDAGGIAAVDVALRRPTLDEVFLHLTARGGGDPERAGDQVREAV
ncbi:ATP-binding cassette domain-containing protein [Actinomadura geliboluensis]|uniref:ATP-binding cassette domain-containing protein n=1 Tax=Actinomadura geliboluensis TaxID=882440 RepID=A0A5S4H9T6_9ACTN|nr:ATP-binding cassette domain-containing protein [Actinomadura geliboluensis]TMR41739.1 ATP-binding cassette domain-containing protein [Actinomadura geliboluensis]